MEARTYQESFTTEHGAELFADALEEFLNRGGVSDERGRHLQAPGRNAASSSEDVIRDPFNDCTRVSDASQRQKKVQ
jgi:hypothetical protein